MSRARLRTAVEKKKALAQLSELRMSGKLRRSMVIAELTDGDFLVLGQEMKPHELPKMLHIAAMAIESADSVRLQLKSEPLEYSIALGETTNPGERIRPKITRDAAGYMVPPEGESIISCPECRHPRYYVLVPEDPLGPPVSRIACAHCGNEVAWVREDEG